LANIVAQPNLAYHWTAKEEIRTVPKHGCSSGVDFGPVNFVNLAESFGAAGLNIDHPDEIAPTLKKSSGHGASPFHRDARGTTDSS
jgi:thiamine pyrophosphate-dependent acetolactate synthase large subunit-like protein